jgi:glycosyltransferase involved in cell wall biosynthesis
VLLRAFHKLRLSDNSVTHSLVLFGDGECRGRLQQLAADLDISNSIIFAGQRDNIDELLPAFDVVVSSSFSEGMSNSLIEAASVGIPVVASNVGGNPEVVLQGSSGLLFAVGDYNDLCQQLRTLLASPEQAREMGSRARYHAEKDFGIKSKIAQHAEAYSKAIETRFVGAHAS